MLLFERPLLGTLRQALAEDAIPSGELNHVLLGVALGIEYLHAINIVHGMLSSECVLLFPWLLPAPFLQRVSAGLLLFGGGAVAACTCA